MPPTKRSTSGAGGARGRRRPPCSCGKVHYDEEYDDDDDEGGGSDNRDDDEDEDDDNDEEDDDYNDSYFRFHHKFHSGQGGEDHSLYKDVSHSARRDDSPVPDDDDDNQHEHSTSSTVGDQDDLFRHMRPDASWTSFAFSIPDIKAKLARGEKLQSKVFYSNNGWAWRLDVHLRGTVDEKYIACFLCMVPEGGGGDRRMLFVLDIVCNDGAWLSSLSSSSSSASSASSNKCGYVGESVFRPEEAREFGFQKLCSKAQFRRMCCSTADQDEATIIARVKPLPLQDGGGEEDGDLTVYSPEYVSLVTKQLVSSILPRFSFVELAGIFASIWNVLVNRTRIDFSRQDNARAAFLVLFHSMPHAICAHWFRDHHHASSTTLMSLANCTTTTSSSNGGGGDVPDLIQWLEQEHKNSVSSSSSSPSSSTPSKHLLCKVCGDVKHRGKCRMTFARDFVLNTVLRVALSARPVQCYIEQLRFEQEDVADAGSNSTGAAAELAEALREAEAAVGATCGAMDQIVDLVEHTTVFLRHGEQLKPKVRAFGQELPKLVAALQSACQVLNVDKYKQELDFIVDELHATQKQLKQGGDALEEKQRAQRELEELETKLAKCTAKRDRSEADFAKCKQHQLDSTKRLASVRKDAQQRVGELNRQVQQTVDCMAQMESYKRSLEDARRKKKQLEQDLAKATLANQQAKLAWEAAQPAPKPFASAPAPAPVAVAETKPCSQCGRQDATGVLEPCLHGLCEACFQETEDTSQMVGVPFLQTECEACQAALHAVRFPGFSFDVAKGERTSPL